MKNNTSFQFNQTVRYYLNDRYYDEFVIVILNYFQNMEIEEYGVICEGKETTLRASRQGLPPTPPSSASSDSEGTASASCSPERRDSQTSTQNLRGLLAPRLYVTNGTHTTRQPIHTPLISCQPVRHHLKELDIDDFERIAKSIKLVNLARL